MKRNIVAALGISIAVAGFGVAAQPFSSRPIAAIAKNGADDPAGDVKGEGPKHPKTAVAKNGADDPAGDVKGEGPKHPKASV